MASPCTRRIEDISSNDLFITPIEALCAIQPYLCKDLDKNTEVLDPCSGLGDITHWLKNNTDSKIVANELYICKDSNKLLHIPEYNEDFLEWGASIPCADVIVANVPYNKASEFILKGFEHAPVQWHFLRLSFLEGQKRFEELFNLGKLSDVYIFTYRVSCPKGIDREKTANSVCYAWYRFDKDYCGQPRLHWLTKPNLKGESK